METVDRTGVEMEAMTACTIAALTVYDMCKSSDRTMTIEHVALWEKSGGRRARGGEPRCRILCTRCAAAPSVPPRFGLHSGHGDGTIARGRVARRRQGDHRHRHLRWWAGWGGATSSSPVARLHAAGCHHPRRRRAAGRSGRRPAASVSPSSSSSPRAALTSSTASRRCTGGAWAAAAIATLQRHVPVITAATGPVVSGPALLLGLSDLVVMSSEAVAFVSGPQMVAEFTGIEVGIGELGGVPRTPGRAGCVPWNPTTSRAPLPSCSEYLPSNTDEVPPLATDQRLGTASPRPSCVTVIPERKAATYDVRDVRPRAVRRRRVP